MEYILVLLIVALLNGAIAYIDGLMEGIIPLTLYAEQYMSTLAGVDLFQSLFRSVYKELHADHETGAADNK